MKSFKIIALLLFAFSKGSLAQGGSNYITTKGDTTGMVFLSILLVSLLAVLAFRYIRFRGLSQKNRRQKHPDAKNMLATMNAKQISSFLALKHDSKGSLSNTNGTGSSKIGRVVSIISLLFVSNIAIAQDVAGKSLWSQSGIIITIVLLVLPLLLAALLIMNSANKAIKNYANTKKIKQATLLAEEFKNLDNSELQQQLIQRRQALGFSLSNNELTGNETPANSKGIIQNISDKPEVHFTASKRKAAVRPSLEPAISKLIVWYLGCAAFWLLLGSGIGEYVGIKFVVPDADHVSWLSFGRLRPVHTNMVFWGWASLGILGLGYYVVPTVSNTKLYSVKLGWIALVLTNLQVTLGTISLMAGINNGGGEFREYIWPIMALFAVALILTLFNFIKTVANRTTKEIYISNWFIVSALIFTIIVALTAYLPFWQNGIGETIIQGYYMHSGVGMWFTLFTVGLLYYFIPQQLNKPIYAYSLGILAFWTQILFYTIIGTHHFVFSAIPWWLQTVAIVGSMGMIIPVVAATINFGMTFKGHWNKVSNSYTIPFFLTAVVYYFMVSMQGTAEAFRFTNLIWHFTDFTVGHSHLGFYGIITFAIWGGTYAIVPRLTGKEPPQHLVGAHFWLAFIGLLLYAVPLMIGGTMKGLMWLEHKPFIDSVVLMFEYWVWRAIGGSLMFISHIIYFYNFYRMTHKAVEEIDVKEEAFRQLDKESLIINKNSNEDIQQS